jgi:hypothetical protein
MYLDPDFEKHPSIYAAKSLIAYHHVNNCILPQPCLSIYDIFKDITPPPSEPIQENLQSFIDSQVQVRMT